MSQKHCRNFRQISTNFDNFWQKDGKVARIMRHALIFHFTYSSKSCHHTSVLNAQVSNCYTMLRGVVYSEQSDDLIRTK